MLKREGYNIKKARYAKQNIIIIKKREENEKKKIKTKNGNSHVRNSPVAVLSIPGYLTHFTGCISTTLKRSAKKTTRFCLIDLRKRWDRFRAGKIMCSLFYGLNIKVTSYKRHILVWLMFFCFFIIFRRLTVNWIVYINCFDSCITLVSYKH